MNRTIAGLIATLITLCGSLTADEPKPRVDLYGDPLPPGALARFGTVRFRHAGSFSSVIAPDGKIIATGGAQDIRLWDAKTGKLLRKLENYHHSQIRFTPDGRYLFGSCQDPNEWHQIDIATGRVERRLPVARGDNWLLCLSPDSKHAVFSTRPGPLEIWDAVACVRVRTLEGHDYPSSNAMYSSDGKLLFSTTTDRHLCQWDMQTGKLLRRTADPLLMWRTVRFSHDGRTLAVVPWSSDAVQLWDTLTLKERLTLQEDPASSLYGLAFTADDKVLATSWNEDPNEETLISFWDTATGKRTRQIKLPAQLSNSLEFMPDGQTLMTTREDCVVRLWDAQTGQPRRDLAAHDSPVRSLAFAPDGKTLVSTASYDIRVWEASSGKHLRHLRGHRWFTNDVSVLPDGQTIVSVGADGAIRFHDLANGRETDRLLLGEPPEKQTKPKHQIICLSVARDGRTLAIYAHDLPKYSMQIWDLEKRKPIHVVTRVPHGSRLSFNSDLSRRLFTNEASTCVEDTTNGHALVTVPAEGRNGYFNAFSPDSRTFVTTSLRLLFANEQTSRDESIIQVWETATGEERLRIVPPANSQRLAFSGDGRRLAIPQANETLEIRDVPTGKELLKLTGLPVGNYALAFSPDGTRLATSHADSTILLWDISSTIAQAGAAKPVDDKQLDAWWQDLAGEDAKKAHQAIWGLIDRPEHATNLLKQRLTPVAKLDLERVKELVKQLDSDQFALREQAMKELAALEELAEPTLREASKGNLSPEKRRRVDTLLSRSTVVTNKEVLRRIRAVEVLEHIGTPAAREVLQKVAEGEPASRATQEALVTLRRLTPAR